MTISMNIEYQLESSLESIGQYQPPDCCNLDLATNDKTLNQKDTWSNNTSLPCAQQVGRFFEKIEIKKNFSSLFLLSLYLILIYFRIFYFEYSLKSISIIILFFSILIGALYYFSILIVEFYLKCFFFSFNVILIYFFFFFKIPLFNLTINPLYVFLLYLIIILAAIYFEYYLFIPISLFLFFWVYYYVFFKIFHFTFTVILILIMLFFFLFFETFFFNSSNEELPLIKKKTITKNSNDILEEYFEKNFYPCVKDVIMLANKANITTNQVSRWMSYRRNQIKRHNDYELNSKKRTMRKELLADMFAKTNRPNKQEISQLIESTEMSRPNIIKWFSRQRNKMSTQIAENNFQDEFYQYFFIEVGTFY
jgi:hypothetical protein